MAMQKLFPTGSWRKIAAVGASGAVLLSGCGSGGGGDDTYEWSLAEAHPKDYPTTQADIWFADQMRERTDGRIDIEVMHGGQLGEEADVLEQVQMGAVEMTRVSTSPVSEVVDEFGVFALPYVFDDEDHLWRFLEGDYAQGMLDDVRDSGYVGLAYYEAGARNFYTVDEPIESPEDLEGQDIRVLPGTVNVEMVEAMGGSGVTMDYGEVYSSLESGTITGAENNEPSYVSSGHYETAEYYTRDAHQRIPEILMVSADLFDSMSEEDQELLREVAQESIAEQRKLWDAEVEESIAEMEDSGIEVIDVETEEFQDATADMVENKRSEYSEVMDAIDEARE
ncbi:tripartite ATP-independent transporter DctP family solute receptor [Lipingzhangella halophila]|uniref:Tripartite ATP-independent transporter DctP family solute receptor n=1 Tax=Lipingzhangella halophila TaxID=1783352 RepID=A0A7W7RNG6_9ACTN|nr:TRAP transporter substrate-binding protein [Lipingzhangella halophila]MBB4935230.1 tripartite ATP-independent transporter DctP family solute receptor [Lipingzhangella halophila]